MRLPETLHPEFRRSLDWREMTSAIAQTIRDPLSRGYTLAMTISFSALIAYISSIQQIVFDAFHEGRYIGLVFACNRGADGARVLAELAGRRPVRSPTCRAYGGRGLRRGDCAPCR